MEWYYRLQCTGYSASYTTHHAAITATTITPATIPTAIATTETATGTETAKSGHC